MIYKILWYVLTDTELSAMKFDANVSRLTDNIANVSAKTDRRKANVILGQCFLISNVVTGQTDSFGKILS